MKKGRIYHRGTGAEKMCQAEAAQDADTIIAHDKELQALQNRLMKEAAKPGNGTPSQKQKTASRKLSKAV